MLRAAVCARRWARRQERAGLSAAGSSAGSSAAGAEAASAKASVLDDRDNERWQ